MLGFVQKWLNRVIRGDPNVDRGDGTEEDDDSESKQYSVVRRYK